MLPSLESTTARADAPAPPPLDATPAPPRFEDAQSLRQRSRTAGMDPSYWYPVEFSRALRPGEVREVVFQGESIAVFRSDAGRLAALENRCPHRRLKLSAGAVEGCRLVCAYHGWSFDEEGRLAGIPHELFGRRLPRLGVRAYPVRERYGLVWIFPGDPALAEARRIPDIPEIEGPGRWACVPVSFTWNAHHSMILDNVSDFTHAHLHRKYRPFVGSKLVRCEPEGDRVTVAYDTQVGRGRISGRFVDRRRIDTDHMTLCYEYPYQWSNTDDRIKHWLFVLPIGPRRTRAFFLFYFESLKVPGLPVRIPRRLMTPLLHVANRLLIRPLLAEDGVAVEAEQEGFDHSWHAGEVELNPAVREFQKLTVRKWTEHLARSGA